VECRLRHAVRPENRGVCIPAGHDLRMAAIAGRRRRASTGGVHVLLQGRVDPAIKERADRGAAARGVSIVEARRAENLLGLRTAVNRGLGQAAAI
jgi:hypothetical protein